MWKKGHEFSLCPESFDKNQLSYPPFRTTWLRLISPHYLLALHTLCRVTSSWKPSILLLLLSLLEYFFFFSLGIFFKLLCVYELAHVHECGFPAFLEPARMGTVSPSSILPCMWGGPKTLRLWPCGWRGAQDSGGYRTDCPWPASCSSVTLQV